MKLWLLAVALGITLAMTASGQTPRLLAYDERPGPLRIYVFETGELHELPLPLDRSPSLTSDGQLIAAGGPSSIVLYRWQPPGPGFIELPGLDQPEFGESDPALSSTGRFIAYSSFEIDNRNVRLYDTGSQKRIRTRGLNTDTFNEFHPAISADGRWIAFTSDRNGPEDAHCKKHAGCSNWDVFLYDRVAGALVDLPGLNSAGEPDHWPSISADGRFIVFATTGQRTHGKRSILLYDRETQTIDLLPKVNGPPGRDHAFRNFMPSISDDGRYIAFSNLEPRSFLRLFDRLTDSFVPMPSLGYGGGSPWVE